MISEELIPAIRRSVARSLYNGGMSQGVISSLIGTSQAMVSKYVKSEAKPEESLRVLVEEISSEITTAAMAGEGTVELTERLNIDVLKALERGRLCKRHKEMSAPSDCKICLRGSSSGDRSSVIRDLNLSAIYLESNPIPLLIPAVKVNVAQAVEDAETIDDIASFPGRISFHGGRVNHLPPDFGISQHLASVLLSVLRSGERYRSVINLRFDESVKKTLEKMGQPPLHIARSDKDVLDTLEERGGGKNGLVADPGDFGIEPCLYIFGISALDVVRRASIIHDHLERLSEVRS